MKLIVAAFIGRRRTHAENDASGIPSLSVMLEKLAIKSRVSPAVLQPFGSMPRCCSSFLRIRFIQVASDESPSCLATLSSCARNSSVKRIWYCGDRFSSCVDMVITRIYYYLHGKYHCKYRLPTKQRPAVLEHMQGVSPVTLSE